MKNQKTLIVLFLFSLVLIVLNIMFTQSQTIGFWLRIFSLLLLVLSLFVAMQKQNENKEF